MNIGIDFGTTKTLVSYWDERRQTPDFASLGTEGRLHLPTVIHVAADGTPSFGDDAEECRVVSPEGYVPGIKRGLGDEESSNLYLHGKTYKRVDLIATFLAELKKRVETETLSGKTTVTGAVLTVPALFGADARAELEDAARRAGFSEVTLLDEPTAAGIAFLQHQGGESFPRYLAVFDWGGGTLDIVVMENQGGNYKPVSNLIGGDPRLGGEDIDDRLFSHFVEAKGLDPAAETEDVLHRLRNQIRERVKHPFYKKDRQSVRWRFRPGWEIELSRGEFVRLVEPEVDAAVSALRAVLAKATDGRPDNILYIGGSSKLGGLQEAIESKTGLKGISWDQHERAVCLGAGYATREGVHKPDKTINTTPKTELTTYDRSTYSCPLCGKILLLTKYGYAHNKYSCPFCNAKSLSYDS